MKKAISILCAIALTLSCFCVSAFADTRAGEYHVTEIIEFEGTFVVDGNSVPARFFCTNITKEAVGDAESILAEYSITRDGQTVDGERALTQAYKSITVGEMTLSSEDFNGGREGDYVVGIIFINVETDDDIEVTIDGRPVEPAPQNKGMGNTDLRGAEIKDVDGDGVIRVACVGDSITAGTPETNYPKHLQEYLNYLGNIDGNTYVVKNHGKGGAACRHVEENVDINNGSWQTVTDADGDGRAYFYYDDIAYTSSLTYTPDVVIVQMGTNDAIFNNWDNWDNYFDNDYYEYLVKPYAEKGALVIMSTPPYACNGWHTDNCNGPVHDKEIALAAKLDLPVVDTNRLMFGMDDYFADGLHGNEAGYRYMALNFYKYIFGGGSSSGTVITEPGAKVTLVDKATGYKYTLTTDATGKAMFEFMEGKDYSFDVSVTCEGFKSNTGSLEIVNGTGSAQIALSTGDFIISYGATVTASTQNTADGRIASKVVDGDSTSDGSRWECEESDAQAWIMLDLGSVKKADAIRVYWEAARASKYQVQYSVNGVNWTTVEETSEDEGMKRTNLGGEKDLRYVRINCIEKANTKYRYSIYEIEVLTQNQP